LRGGMGGAEGIEGTRTRCLMVREHEVWTERVTNKRMGSLLTM
jgi:hypothetical protein